MGLGCLQRVKAGLWPEAGRGQGNFGPEVGEGPGLRGPGARRKLAGHGAGRWGGGPLWDARTLAVPPLVVRKDSVGRLFRAQFPVHGPQAFLPPRHPGPALRRSDPSRFWRWRFRNTMRMRTPRGGGPRRKERSAWRLRAWVSGDSRRAWRRSIPPPAAAARFFNSRASGALFWVSTWARPPPS